MGGRRPRPCLQHLPRPDLGPRRPTGHPAKAHRCAGRLPALDLRQPALGREPLGATERGAGNRNPLRENRQVLPRRPILRRHLRLAQGLTGLRRGTKQAGERTALPRDPHSPAFWRAIEALGGANPITPRGSVAWLVAQYRESEDFKGLADSTRASYDVHLRRFENAEAWGLFPARDLSAPAVLKA